MNKKHILVIDDDQVGGELLRDHLLEEGFVVTLATNCAEGKHALKQSAPIDAVILDQFLPDGLGIDLLRSMTPEDGLQKPPVIVSSSWVRPDDPAWEQILHRLPEVSQSLVQAFVPKPYLLDSLDSVLTLVFTHAPVGDSKTITAGDYPKKR